MSGDFIHGMGVLFCVILGIGFFAFIGYTIISISELHSKYMDRIEQDTVLYKDIKDLRTMILDQNSDYNKLSSLYDKVGKINDRLTYIEIQCKGQR